MGGQVQLGNCCRRWCAAISLLLTGCASFGGKAPATSGPPAMMNSVPPASTIQTAPSIPQSAPGNAGKVSTAAAKPVAATVAYDGPQQATPSENLPPPAQAAPNAQPLPFKHGDAGQLVPGGEPVAAAPDKIPSGVLDLAGAVDLALRTQPRLRAYVAGVAQAQAASEIAFAPYLPVLSGGVSGGGYDLNVTGQAGGFSFFLPGATIPIGLNLQSAFALEEVRLQWLLCDFGRRQGRYHQAQIAVEIARLQTDRAYQTTVNEVTAAYFQVLRADALQRVGREAVHRAADDLDVARKLHGQGAIEREKVLRAEVQLSQAERLLDSADSAVVVSVAALNLAIGIDVCLATKVIPFGAMPQFDCMLCDCLGHAVNQRRELAVAHQGVLAAQEGQSVARADFAPKIVGDGAFLNLQQATPQADAALGVGFIRLEWGLFEGGKRLGELHAADAKTRAAMDTAKSIADTISFQIIEAYRQMITARKGIDRAQPAVDQSLENYRLIKARAVLGDATAAEITDAETSLTRAQQDYLTSTYDYLTALARLEFAMGVPTAASVLRNR